MDDMAVKAACLAANFDMSKMHCIGVDRMRRALAAWCERKEQQIAAYGPGKDAPNTRQWLRHEINDLRK